MGATKKELADTLGVAKQTVVNYIERLGLAPDHVTRVGKYDVLHGLVANPQPNPQCTESNEKLDALYQQAIPLAVRLIEAYAETLDTDEPLDKAYDHTFGEF